MTKLPLLFKSSNQKSVTKFLQQNFDIATNYLKKFTERIPTFPKYVLDILKKACPIKKGISEQIQYYRLNIKHWRQRCKLLIFIFYGLVFHINPSRFPYL